MELDAFKYQVFIDFREVQDNEKRQYSTLAAYLNGRGVPDLEEAWKEMILQPLHHAFREFFNAHLIHRALNAISLFHSESEERGDLGSQEIASLPPYSGTPRNDIWVNDSLSNQGFLDEIEQKAIHFLREAKRQSGGSGDEIPIARAIRGKLESVLQFPAIADQYPWTVSREGKPLFNIFKRI